MIQSINDVLEQEKRATIKKDSLLNKIWMEVWDKVVDRKHITFRPRSVDRVIDRVQALPFLAYCYDYKENVVNQLNADSKAVETLASFMTNSSAEEFKFFLAQMNKNGDTAWFVKEYLFGTPRLHDAINEIIEKGQLDKVKTAFAFAFDSELDLRITPTTHPNSFPAYAECKCSGEVAKFLDNFLNYNIIIFNDYLKDVQEDCLNYNTFEQFYGQFNFYDEVKKFDLEGQIQAPTVLYTTFLTFKKLNESKVWGNGEKFSVNKFVERDEIRRKYDDFNLEEESKVQKLYKETIQNGLESER